MKTISATLRHSTALLALLGILAGAAPTHAAGFTASWNDGKIYGPDGKEFIIKGTNAFSTQNDPARIMDCWKFNAVRINWVPGDWDDYQKTTYIQNMVNTFTARKAVVIIAYHGPWDQNAINAFATKFGALYKDNPYVWINPYNEFFAHIVTVNGAPAFDPNETNTWINGMRNAIQVIRNTGFKNPIFIDSMQWSQDILTQYTYGPPVFDKPFSQTSAIMMYGPKIAAGFDNIAFDIHVYDIFNVGGDFTAYIKALRDAHIPVVVGEFGAEVGGARIGAVQKIFNALKTYNFGIMVWHWAAGDPNDLTTVSPGGGDLINSCTNPTNLTPMAQLIWANNRAAPVGGLSTSPSTPPASTPTPPVPVPTPTPAPAPVPTPTPPATTTSNVTIQAESMYHSSGNLYNSGTAWLMDWDGNLKQDVAIPAAGTYTLTLTAMAQLAGGVGASVDVYLDYKKIGTVMVNSTTMVNYSLPSQTLSAGKHAFGLVFTNDAAINGQNRNLIVDKVVFGGSAATMPPPPPPASTPTPPAPVVTTVTVEAETMYHSSGKAYPNGWFMDWSGDLKQDVTIPSAGTYKLTMVAMAQLAGGVGASVDVIVDYKKVATVMVNSTTMANYVLPSLNLTAGKHALGIVFTNDAAINGQNRNFILDKVTFTK